MCTILNKQNVKPSLCKFNLLTSNWELSNFRGWNLKLESPQFHFHNVQYLIKFSLDLQRKRKVGSIVKKNKKQLIETKSKIVHVFPLAKPFFFFLPAAPSAHGSFQGRDQIWAAAVTYNSYSNALTHCATVWNPKLQNDYWEWVHIKEKLIFKREWIQKFNRKM